MSSAQGEVVGIEVNGNGNRVAGRDYIEISIKPCPSCEMRVIEPCKKMCNHCWETAREQKAKAILSVLIFCVLFFWGAISQWRAKNGLPNDMSTFFETGVVAIFIVGLGVCVFQLLRLWLEIRKH